jgi:hypothetical protein
MGIGDIRTLGEIEDNVIEKLANKLKRIEEDEKYFYFLKVYIMETKERTDVDAYTCVRVEKIEDNRGLIKESYTISMPKRCMSAYELIKILMNIYKGQRVLKLSDRVEQIEIYEQKYKANEWLESIALLHKLAECSNGGLL